MLTAKTSDNDYVEAASAAHGAAYFCRGCGQPVVFKAGRLRAKHFAHYAAAECSYGALMSAEHLEAQRVLAGALRARGVNAELEMPIASLVGDRRADLLAWPPDRPEARIAIEVQASDITVEQIDSRTHSYNSEGIAPLWLRLYDFGRWESPTSLVQRRTIWIDKHRLRAWERWAHDQLGGRLWFMDSQTFLVWRATFVPAHRYNEHNSWFEPGGEERSAGGDWSDIKAWVELELEGPFDVQQLQLARGRIVGPDRRTRLAAWFLLPGEAGRPTEPLVRAHFAKHGPRAYFPSREVQARLNEAWVTAEFTDAAADWRSVEQAEPR